MDIFKTKRRGKPSVLDISAPIQSMSPSGAEVYHQMTSGSSSMRASPLGSPYFPEGRSSLRTAIDPNPEANSPSSDASNPTSRQYPSGTSSGGPARGHL